MAGQISSFLFCLEWLPMMYRDVLRLHFGIVLACHREFEGRDCLI